MKAHIRRDHPPGFPSHLRDCAGNQRKPPDALILSPVIHAASSEARKTTTGATSCGCPKRAPSAADRLAGCASVSGFVPCSTQRSHGAQATRFVPDGEKRKSIHGTNIGR